MKLEFLLSTIPSLVIFFSFTQGALSQIIKRRELMLPSTESIDTLFKKAFRKVTAGELKAASLPNYASMNTVKGTFTFNTFLMVRKNLWLAKMVIE